MISDEKAKILLHLLIFSIPFYIFCISKLKKYRMEKSEANSKAVRIMDSLVRFFNVSIEEDNYIYLLRVSKFLSITFIIYMYYSFFPYHSPSLLNKRLYEFYNFFYNLLDIGPIYVRRRILEIYFSKEVLEIFINTISWSYINSRNKSRGYIRN